MFAPPRAHSSAGFPAFTRKSRESATPFLRRSCAAESKSSRWPLNPPLSTGLPASFTPFPPQSLARSGEASHFRIGGITPKKVNAQTSPIELSARERLISEFCRVLYVRALPASLTLPPPRNTLAEMNAVPTNEQIISLTESAANQARELLAKEESPAGKGLRIFIESGGCSGLQYGLVFDERREGDFQQEFNGVPVLVDNVSAEYLKGSTVDYSDSMTGGGFKISNPRAKSSCGCGKSFEA